MSNNNNGSPQGGNPFSGGATYQSVIIALVAGGVLSTGLVTLVWRRRRYREMEREMDRAVRDGRERYRTRREREERDSLAGGGKGRRGGLGAAPQIWDAVVGEKPPILLDREVSRVTAEEQEPSEKEGPRAVDVDMSGQEEETGDIDVDGLMKEGWSPTSVSFLRTGQAGTQTRASYASAPTVAEVSVLIAMPSEDQYHSLYGHGASANKPSFAVLDAAGGSTLSPMIPNTPLPPYFNPYTPSDAGPRGAKGTAEAGQYPTLHSSVPNAETFPILQLATTCAPVSAGSMAEREEIDRLVAESGGTGPLARGIVIRAGDGWAGNTAGSSAGSGERRVERVDGFRGDDR